MKLYIFQVAPNPTRVRLFVAEKRAAGAVFDLPEVSVNLAKGEHRSAEHLARNPLGRLPVLELDDGSFLTESGAIIEYLEERLPQPSLLGDSPVERARSRELDRQTDLGVLGPVARIIHATKSPLGLPPVPEIAEAGYRALPEGLGVIDACLSDERPFLGGTRPMLADCTLQAALQFARFAELELELPERVARWDRNYRERDAARSVLVV